MWTELFRPQPRVALVVHSDPVARARAIAQVRISLPTLEVVEAITMHEALDLVTFRDVDFVAAAAKLPDGTADDLFRVLTMAAHGRAVETKVIDTESRPPTPPSR
ncbi:MAG: hypothetical protein AABZ30_06210 [Myxococcota bacterium]